MQQPLRNDRLAVFAVLAQHLKLQLAEGVAVCAPTHTQEGIQDRLLEQLLSWPLLLLLHQTPTGALQCALEGPRSNSPVLMVEKCSRPTFLHHANLTD